MAEFLQKVALDLSSGAVAPDVLFPFKPSEIRVEIGFGGGERLIEQATLNPWVGFIGCEPFVNGVAKAIAAISDRKLTNVRVHCGDARDVLAILPSASLDRIELLYPDPWPKHRHRKRRIVSLEFLEEAARLLKPGRELWFATDIDDYCGWTLDFVRRSAQFDWPARRACDWLRPWAGWTPTRYEQKARRENRPSAYLTFVRM